MARKAVVVGDAYVYYDSAPTIPMVESVELYRMGLTWSTTVSIDGTKGDAYLST